MLPDHPLEAPSREPLRSATAHVDTVGSHVQLLGSRASDNSPILRGVKGDIVGITHLRVVENPWNSIISFNNQSAEHMIKSI